MTFSAFFLYRFWIYRILPLVLTGILAINNAGMAAAPGFDPSREQNWAEQITAHLRVGEAIWLPSALGKFLTLYTKAIGRGSNQGVVIMFPAPNTHPDSDPISTLRILLTHHGWHTLAVQLPTILIDSPPSEYVFMLPTACARLHEAMTWLAGQQLANIVVLGHGLGAAVAAACVAGIEDKNAIHGLILLGVGGADSLPPALDLTVSLEKFTQPILDIYGESDLLAVRAGARAREARRRNRSYVQTLIPATDHRLTGLEEVVVGRIAGWLRHYAPGPNPVKPTSLFQPSDNLSWR